MRNEELGISIADQSCAQAPSVAILRHNKPARIICRGEHRSPVLRTCKNFEIVGAWLNFGFTEMRQPDISRLLNC